MHASPRPARNLPKIPHARAQTRTLDARTLGAKADHFHWMKHPRAVADALLRD